jgi:hypothetical protein
MRSRGGPARCRFPARDRRALIRYDTQAGRDARNAHRPVRPMAEVDACESHATEVYYMPQRTVPGLLGFDLVALNAPRASEYVTHYCRHANRDGIPDMNFYLVFNFFRLATICHGIRGRLLRGTAVSIRAKEYASCVEQFAAIAWDLTERGI